MTDASDRLSTGFTPSEALMFENAECRTCDIKRHDDARAWAHEHVRETGHAIELTLGYDVRPDDWLDRVTPERRADLDELVKNPDAVRGVAEQILLESEGQKLH
jgi:hypothetical protein